MICARCGIPHVENNLCVHHVLENGDGWAEANKILCDLLHRGKEPVRLNAAERSTDYWGG